MILTDRRPLASARHPRFCPQLHRVTILPRVRFRHDGGPRVKIVRAKLQDRQVCFDAPAENLNTLESEIY
jgi:hypothetical protein